MKTYLSVLLLVAVFAPVAVAQEMPAPRRMPRAPVSREALASPHDVAPASHQTDGMATIIDGDKLRIGETDLRLFGIVPPQLAASFGPQARNALDNLTNGQITNCAIRDRDREGRLLATCHNAAGNDLALELLKRGLAVTARGSIANTEFAAPYMAAEQAAQNAHTGLWSVAPPTPAPASAYAALPVAPPVVAPPVVAPPTPTVNVAPTPVISVPAKPIASPAPETKAEVKKEETPTKIAADVASQQTQSQALARIDDTQWNPAESVGFFERYQILIACALMLATTLSIITALWAQKRRDRMDEMKAIAAALRGELMAARSVCIGRAKSITTDDEDYAALWPRIRATLYHASVARLGILGADLARHVASIYGQSGDYAALYSPTNGTQDAPKKHALESLAKHIDNVLPTLAYIEKTGHLPRKPLIPTPVIPTPAAPTYRDTPRAAQAVPETTHPESTATEIDERETQNQPIAEALFAPPEKNASRRKRQISTSLPMEAIQEVTLPQMTESIADTAPPIHAIPPTPIARASSSLWDNLRNLLKAQRAAFPDIVPASTEEDSEYAALIEADMAHYQYDTVIEPLDISPQKKQG